MRSAGNPSSFEGTNEAKVHIDQFFFLSSQFCIEDRLTSLILYYIY